MNNLFTNIKTTFLNYHIELLANNNGSDKLQDAQTEILNTIKNVFGIATPIIMTIVAIFIIVKIILIGIKIAKAADEPEERSKYIKALVWWCVGLGICILAATVVPGVIYGVLGVN